MTSGLRLAQPVCEEESILFSSGWANPCASGTGVTAESQRQTWQSLRGKFGQ